MLVSHGAYYGFFSIHLENLGYGSTFIGIAWALASTAEILVMIKSDKIFDRFSLENVLFKSRRFLAQTNPWLRTDDYSCTASRRRSRTKPPFLFPVWAASRKISYWALRCQEQTKWH